MSNPLRKVSPGEPVAMSAATHNALVDSARDYRMRRLQQRRRARAVFRQPGFSVLVKNSSAGTVRRFGVLALSSPIFTPSDNLDEFLNNPSLFGIAPTGASTSFAVMQEPVAVGKIGRGIVHGFTPVTLSVTSETIADTFATLDTSFGTQGLVAATNGSAEILFKQPGTGTKWALVRLGLTPP